MKKEYSDILDPNNILIDDRSMSDRILLLKKLASRYTYYNRKNRPEGDFSSLLETDESFLIAEISKFETAEKDQKRLNLISNFDQSSSSETKEAIFIEFLGITAQMFNFINHWYTASKKNNLSEKSSKIELELERVIENKLANGFLHFRNYLDFFESKGLIEKNSVLNLEEYQSVIWKTQSSKIDDPIFDYEDRDELISNSFKKIILISSEIFDSIYNLANRSQRILDESLYKNNNHKAHIGLLFAFIELMQHVQNDINTFSKKHLDLFYKTILKQNLIETQAVKTFVTIEIDENSNEIVLSNDNLLIAGQYDDGSVVQLEMQDEIKLNNVKIAELMTIFISRNADYDFNSKYQLIASIYERKIANSIAEVNSFNSDQSTFSTLGRDQDSLTQTEMTMQTADVGFLISSSILKLERSDRKIKVEFNFSVSSINYLSDLIIDISNNTELNEEEVFYRVFSNAFTIQYTTGQGWNTIESYEVISPEDWTSATISLILTLNKLDPAFVNFDKSIHGLEITAVHPVLRISLNQSNFYNSYSFLNTLELMKIDLDVEVENLKNLKIYRDGQLVDINSEFDLLGPLAKYGSKTYIGCEELFNKKVSEFSLSWNYTNIPPKCKNISAYYSAYKQRYSNKSFKLKLNALSDFNYHESESSQYTFNLFESDKDNTLLNTRSVSFDNLEDLRITPNFDIDSNYLKEFSNDIETGLLKLELISPLDGFGFDIYPKIYADSLAAKYSNKKVKKGEGEINEPFSPQINNLQIRYKANTSLVFNDADRAENDPLEKNEFFQISPFGIEKTFSKNLISSKRLFYDFINEGELIIGLSSQKVFTGLNLLFEIIKSENSNYEFSRKINWYYSSFEGWKKIEKDQILYDETFNLMKTGIISFRFPNDFSKSSKILDQDKFYLKACSEDKADQFSLIKSIVTNAMVCKEVITPNSSNRVEKLKAKSVEGFEKKIPGVLTVYQPFDSATFKVKESENDFYLRVSQLLRHKNRPVTKWDIEKFILNKFDWLSHVNCVHESKSNEKTKLKILCLKKIESFQNIDEIKLSMAEMNQIKETLNEFISPFSEIELVNPIFEDIWIKCKLRFRDISTGKGYDQLNKDLLNFICNWRVEIGGRYPELNTKIKKFDVIKFIKERKYIAFVTGISIVHFKQHLDGSIYAYDTATSNDTSEFIECGTKRSIFVPRNSHKIELLSKDEYHAPEPTNFSELGINKSFVIVKRHEEKLIESSFVDNKLVDNTNNLQFELKI